MTKPIIWLIDTSILCNILDVPGSNQDRDKILQDFDVRIKRGDEFFLPYVAFIEAGNSIAQLSGNYKFDFAQKFVKITKQAMNNEAPFKPLKFPKKEDILRAIDDFPNHASRGIGFGDFSIIEDWKEQSSKFKQYSVKIWSLDQGLQGYES